MSTIVRGPSHPVDLSTVIHHMPCHIAHTGEALVSDYFLPTIRKEKPVDESVVSPGELPASVHFTAAFRGRPLNGREIVLSPKYTGLILEEGSSKEKPSLVNTNCTKKADWNVVAQFGSLCYWNWDKVPSEADGIQQMLQWTRLAETAAVSVRSQMSVSDDFVDSDAESG